MTKHVKITIPDTPIGIKEQTLVLHDTIEPVGHVIYFQVTKENFH